MTAVYHQDVITKTLRVNGDHANLEWVERAVKANMEDIASKQGLHIEDATMSVLPLPDTTVSYIFKWTLMGDE